MQYGEFIAQNRSVQHYKFCQIVGLEYYYWNTSANNC